MSAPARCMRPDRPAPTIDSLTAKARTGAYLFEFGWLDLESTLNQLRRYAERSGAVRELGTDVVETVIAAAFAHIRLEDDVPIAEALAGARVAAP